MPTNALKGVLPASHMSYREWLVGQALSGLASAMANTLDQALSLNPTVQKDVSDRAGRMAVLLADAAISSQKEGGRS